ncbi:MAG: GTPase ObgE [bacterium]
MRFVDEARIKVVGGRGGDGLVHFHREAYHPKGGPDGGDGGKGGDVILRADPHRTTLADVTLKPLFRAPNGRSGGPNRKKGRSGKDLIIPLPVGSQVYDDDTGELIADLTHPGAEVVVAKGGRGGRGNAHFATPSNRIPQYAESGEPGEEVALRIELKLLADVGLVGKPNAGKSTLLRALTRAHPKIADYPFTTLTPHLGVVEDDHYRRWVVADIPGLIEGAHLGKGLGHRFLRHIERTNLLVLLIETPDPDPYQTYNILIEELRGYNPDLLALPRIIVRSKSDLPLPPNRSSFPFDLAISALTGEGLQELVRMMGDKLAFQNERTVNSYCR